MPLADVVDLLYDHLTLGDVVRLHEATCVRETASAEMRHLFFARVGRKPAPWNGTAAQLAAHLVARTRTRCRECGVRCARKCRVCVACARDSYRALVTRADVALVLHAETGWRPSTTSVARRLAHLRVVGQTPRGAYLYWRSEAIA